jgi:hypothetical protein
LHTYFYGIGRGRYEKVSTNSKVISFLLSILAKKCFNEVKQGELNMKWVIWVLSLVIFSYLPFTSAQNFWEQVG